MILFEKMLQVSEEEIKNRLKYDNPWWAAPSAKASRFPQRRHFFKQFYELITQTAYNRAVILLGMRRIGKTVMMRQAIDELIADGVPGNAIFFASLDQPIFIGAALEKLVALFRSEFQHKPDERLYVFFDEIQYLRDWEVHLKVLVDDHPNIRFCASGSAAAALKRQSRESGTGRFTDYLLPGITFAEFCAFRGLNFQGQSLNINEMNRAFIDYINFGGFPETAIDGNAAEKFELHIGQDVTDRVLLRDLPSLYGISDPQELNQLFVMLAYNSGQEISLDGLSQKSNVAKNTIKRYLDYLEAAFLIRRLYRIDQNARRFQRDFTFKVYLTNTSLRTALFGPLQESDENALGHMVETAVFAQIIHRRAAHHLHYVRERDGKTEVDFVALDAGTMQPYFVLEVKWSDRDNSSPTEMQGIDKFLSANRTIRNKIKVIITTRTISTQINKNTATIDFWPAAQLCYEIADIGNLEAIGLV